MFLRITPSGGVSEFERIDIERTRRVGSTIHKWPGLTYDGSSARYTSVFVGWQRNRVSKGKKERRNVLGWLARTQRGGHKGV